MAKQYTRDEVLNRFKATIAEGKPVVIAGAGTGITPCAQRTVPLPTWMGETTICSGASSFSA